MQAVRPRTEPVCSVERAVGAGGPSDIVFSEFCTYGRVRPKDPQNVSVREELQW